MANKPKAIIKKSKVMPDQIKTKTPNKSVSNALIFIDFLLFFINSILAPLINYKTIAFTVQINSLKIKKL